MLHDDPNESSAVYLLTSDNKHTVCGTNFSPMQFNFFAENISDDSSLFCRLSITCPARKKIKFHRCSFLNINVKQTTVCVFHFLNLESLKRIYPSLYTFRDRNSTMCEYIFHQLAVKNVNVIQCSNNDLCQHNSIFLRQKKPIVFII